MLKDNFDKFRSAGKINTVLPNEVKIKFLRRRDCSQRTPDRVGINNLVIESREVTKAQYQNRQNIFSGLFLYNITRFSHFSSWKIYSSPKTSTWPGHYSPQC
jgi:hypothetical protein